MSTLRTDSAACACGAAAAVAAAVDAADTAADDVDMTKVMITS